MSDSSSVSSDLHRAPDHGKLPADCTSETLGVAFFDLSRMAEWTSSEEDARVAKFFQQFIQVC